MATFLTGATGFIGRYLAAAMLEAGEDLVALVRCRDAEEGLERLSKGLAFAGYIGLSLTCDGECGRTLVHQPFE